VFARAAGAIAGTDRAAAVLRGWGYEGPLAVIPQMGVDPGRFRPDPAARAGTRLRIGARDTDFVVAFGGRLVREKGVHLLLDAVAGLDGARLLFLGDGPEREPLARAAARAGVAGRVHFAGPVASAEMPRWLPACDVLALPSLTTRTWAEQFGRILVEAMACGVAVVGSDSGEIPGVIGEAGLIVPEGDGAALRATLARLASSPAERALCAVRGQRRVARQYTNAVIADRTVAFYRELVPERGIA
jgi:glycosyltransferase involved in cell wall biosynthesis